MIVSMAKQAHQKTLSAQKDGFVIEQRSVYDDYLLLRTKEGIEITRLEYRGSRRYNIAALTFAFIVIIAGLSFSTFLIYNSMDIVGTIFAGGTLIMAANAFIKASKKKNPS